MKLKLIFKWKCSRFECSQFTESKWRWNEICMKSMQQWFHSMHNCCPIALSCIRKLHLKWKVRNEKQPNRVEKFTLEIAKLSQMPFYWNVQCSSVIRLCGMESNILLKYCLLPVAHHHKFLRFTFLLFFVPKMTVDGVTKYTQSTKCFFFFAALRQCIIFINFSTCMISIWPDFDELNGISVFCFFLFIGCSLFTLRFL